MISGHVNRQRLGLILSMSIALGISSSNSYGAVSFQGLPLNMVAAPTAVEDVNPELLTGIKAPEVNGDGSVKKAGDGSVRTMGDGSVRTMDGSVRTMDGSVKTGELVPAVHTGGAKHHSGGGGGGAGKAGNAGSWGMHTDLLHDISVKGSNHPNDKGGDAAHGAGGGAGKGAQGAAQVDFRKAGGSERGLIGLPKVSSDKSAAVDQSGGADGTGKNSQLLPAVQKVIGADAAHGAGGGGGTGKAGESSAAVDFFMPGSEQSYQSGGHGHNESGGGGGAGKGADGAAQVDGKAGGSERGLIGLLKPSSEKSAAVGKTGGGGGTGKNSELIPAVHTQLSGDAAHGAGGGGGTGKGGESSAAVDFFMPGSEQSYQSGGHGHTESGGTERGLIGLPKVGGGDAAHGAGGGGGAGKGAEASAQVDFKGGDASCATGEHRPSPTPVDFTGGGGGKGAGGANDIPLDQTGGAETSAKGFAGNLEPAALGGGPSQSPVGTGHGLALPTNVQGKLDLPFSQGAGGKTGFAGGVDVTSRGAYQPQGVGAGKGQNPTSINFTQGPASSFVMQQGALNGAGKTGGFVPFNPGALGTFSVTPSLGGTAGAASSIGAAGGAGARIAPVGVGVTVGGAHATGRSLAPSIMPGALIMPIK